MRVLLVAPTALDATGRPIKLRRLHLPGVTLPILAAHTPPHVHVRLCFETIEDIPYDEQWDLVGLSSMGAGIVHTWQIADEFRRRGVPVVVGGVGATLVSAEASLAHADSIVLGEADEIWPEVIEDAAAGRLKSIYRMTTRPDVARLPVPRYDLIDMSKLGIWRPVQCTRGCPFTCNFCSISAFFERSYRKRPVEHVIRDVRAAKRTGSRYIIFVDDNLCVDLDYCADLWEALIPEDIIWMSQTSLHVTERPELLALAHRSGCRVFSIGVESTLQASLVAVDKEWNRPERYEEAITNARRHGIEVSTEMIVGIDGEDASVFERTYNFIMEQKIVVPRLYVITPVPGTPLYEKMDREGRLLSTDIGRYTGGNVVFQPLNFTVEELQTGYWTLYEKVYTYRSIFKRLARNRAALEPVIRAVMLGINMHYRRDIRGRVTPGLV